MESTRKTVKDSVFFFFFFFFFRSTAVNGNGGGQRSTVKATVTRADVSADVTRADVARQRETRVRRVGAREGAWRRWSHVGARARVAGEPKTSGGAWGRVRGWIRPILVAMDRS
jgi:hypothetical protein